MTGDMSRELGEIDAGLAGYDGDTLAKAEQLAGMSPAQLAADGERKRIDDALAKAEIRRQDAMDEAAAREAEIQAELEAEMRKLEALKAAEAEKLAAVRSALAERSALTTENYTNEETKLSAHVNTLIAEYSRLRAAQSASTASPSVPAFASGGTVYGQSGTDKVLARLTAGEEVINLRASRMYRPLLKQINAMTLPIPGYARGGTVSNSVTHNANRDVQVTQNFHHAAMSDPSAHSWWVSRAARY